MWTNPKQQGLGLVAISYDAPEVLKKFADSRGITFPLISDRGSAIIKRFGLLNTTVAPGTATYGIPFPGTFIVDRRGIVRSRHFEDAYQERNTAASLLVAQGVTPFGPATTAETPHLTLTAAISDAEVAPGERVSLVFDDPAAAAACTSTRRASIPTRSCGSSLDAQPWLRTHEVTYPPSEIYHFKPLDERVEVYQKPFRLVQDVTILATRAQKLVASQSELTITGALEYQACDDKVCYTPQARAGAVGVAAEVTGPPPARVAESCPKRDAGTGRAQGQAVHDAGTGRASLPPIAGIRLARRITNCRCFALSLGSQWRRGFRGTAQFLPRDTHIASDRAAITRSRS